MRALRISRGRRLALLLLLSLQLAGCGRIEWGKVRQGMSQEEVEAVLGKPISVEKEGVQTKLRYTQNESLQYVLLEDGKATCIGGDTIGRPRWRIRDNWPIYVGAAVLLAALKGVISRRRRKTSA